MKENENEDDWLYVCSMFQGDPPRVRTTQLSSARWYHGYVLVRSRGGCSVKGHAVSVPFGLLAPCLRLSFFLCVQTPYLTTNFDEAISMQSVRPDQDSNPPPNPQSSIFFVFFSSFSMLLAMASKRGSCLSRSSSSLLPPLLQYLYPLHLLSHMYYDNQGPEEEFLAEKDAQDCCM